MVTVGAVIAAVRSSDSKSTQEVALAAIGGSNASGRAAVVAHDGGKALKVDTSGLAKLDGSDYELWLMNPDTNSFVSLGSVQPGVRSVHPIPAGVTVKTDPYVDISVEPRDGNPAHSTVSVLRGHF
jgi:anti-sigma-K factor RskA